MKKLFLLFALFGVLAVGCENLLPNELKPTEEAVFVTDGNGAYILEAEGGEVVVSIATNVDYSIVIPKVAQTWLSVAETRAESRMETRTFIIVENDSFETRLADVEFVNGSGKVLKTLLFTQKCYAKVFETDVEGNYRVNAGGGEVNVAVTTNLEYNVTIPEEAQSWLSLADTRVEVREETLTFTVSENETFEERSASAELVDNEGEVLQTISFIQSAAMLPDTSCPSNEIWYTNGSTTKPTTPNKTYVFGANIISNTYSEDSERWIIKFDGDVTTIGDEAFAYRDSLTSVTIGDSVTSIGEGAFWCCSSLTNVTIGDGVATIGERAFEGCSSLTSVTIPDNVTTIGDYAFVDCSSLTSITIPDSVTTIGDYAFCYCRRLTSVIIPDSVTTIGERAFSGCSSLTKFNGKFASEDGRCLIIDGTLNSFAPAGLTKYNIPASVTTIGERAFSGCISLTSVTIPDSVTTIGDGAFGYCSYLTSVTIPDSVTTIGDGAFEGCICLTSVTIPDSVTTIGDFAFYECSGLISITIPDSVTTIEDAAFQGCIRITSVYITDLSAWCKIDFDDSYANPLCYGASLYLNNELVMDLVLPSDVTEIKTMTFWSCRSLTSVTIPNSVTTIGGFAFFYCDSLTSVIIPDSVTTIGVQAFSWCISLTSVIIPDSVTTIGGGAFWECSSLTSVYCKAVTPPTAVLYDDGYWYTFDYNASGRKIYVPTESVEAYKSAEGWSSYADAIVGYDF